MDKALLSKTAAAMVAKGKGILAADESSGTCEKRFQSVHVESTEENRRAYRDMLFTTEGAEEFISGVILFDETIRQKASDGRPLPKILEEQGIIPGIKVDKGTTPLAKSPGELVTDGLDGLRARMRRTERRSRNTCRRKASSPASRSTRGLPTCRSRRRARR